MGKDANCPQVYINVLKASHLFNKGTGNIFCKIFVGAAVCKTQTTQRRLEIPPATGSGNGGNNGGNNGGTSPPIEAASSCVEFGEVFHFDLDRTVRFAKVEVWDEVHYTTLLTIYYINIIIIIIIIIIRFHWPRMKVEGTCFWACQ